MKTTIGKYLILLLVIISYQTAIGQSRSSIILEASQVFSSFRFINDQGHLDNTYSVKVCGAYNIGYQYNWKNGAILGGSIGLNNAGASKAFGSNEYTWDLHYERIKIDLGYTIDKFVVMPYFFVSLYFSYLLKASENTGTVNYDLKKDNNISPTDFGIVGTSGARLPLSKGVQLFAAFNYNLGLQNIETDPGRRLYNRGCSLSLGLVIYVANSATASEQKTIIAK